MTTTRRSFLFFTTLILILAGTLSVILFARGYRLDFTKKRLEGTGLLVATSIPDGAQIWINGELRSATNTTLTLKPDKYFVELKKDGFSSWQKNITINKEEVVKTDTTLFPTAPSFRPIAFDGAVNPILSPNSDRLAYVIPAKPEVVSPTIAPTTPATATPSTSISPSPISLAGQSGVKQATTPLPTKAGLWILDLTDLPLGFSRDPRQITRSTNSLDWSKATLFWSPDSRQILAIFYSNAKQSQVKSAYLLDTTRLNQAAELVDISTNLATVQNTWDSETQQLLLAQKSKLPFEALSILTGSAAKLKFSPDETKVLYLATASATLPEHIIPSLPGSNSQPEQRSLHPGGIYVYDLKEDKNFWILDMPVNQIAKNTPTFPTQDNPISLIWFPTSRHLVKVEPNKVTILEYDSTNQVAIYAGPFFDKAVFPFPNGARIAIITNLGSSDPTPNLYALILR